jgi:hypothetical protein
MGADKRPLWPGVSDLAVRHYGEVHAGSGDVEACSQCGGLMAGGAKTVDPCVSCIATAEYVKDRRIESAGINKDWPWPGAGFEVDDACSDVLA